MRPYNVVLCGGMFVHVSIKGTHTSLSEGCLFEPKFIKIASLLKA